MQADKRHTARCGGQTACPRVLLLQASTHVRLLCDALPALDSCGAAQWLCLVAGASHHHITPTTRPPTTPTPPPAHQPHPPQPHHPATNHTHTHPTTRPPTTHLLRPSNLLSSSSLPHCGQWHTPGITKMCLGGRTGHSRPWCVGSRHGAAGRAKAALACSAA